MSIPLDPHPRRRLALAVISVAQLLVVLSDSVVNIALPAAARDLGMGDADRAWAITSYVLAFGGLLLLAGRVADVVGRRRALVIGLLGFAVASVVGGTAAIAPVFFAARAGQGAFAALMTPAALSLIGVVFTERRDRAVAFSVYGAVSGGGAAAGVVAGGLLTEFASWRWCLLVNVPVAVAAAFAALLVLRESRIGRPERFDVAGATFVTLGFTAVVWALTRAGDPAAGWDDVGTALGLASGVLLLVVFVLGEQRSRSPLVPLRLVLDRVRGGVLAGAVLVNAGLFGVFLFLSYFLQQVLGFGAVAAGLAFLPLSGAIVLTAALGAGAAHRFGERRALTIGTATAAVGLVWLGLLQATGSFPLAVLPAEVLIDVGMCFVFVGQPALVLRGAGPAEVGTTSALLNTAQQVGGAVGTAALNTVFAAASAGGLADSAAYRATFLGSALMLSAACAISLLPAHSADPITRTERTT